MDALWALVVFGVCLVIGVPVAFCLGLAAVFYIVVADGASLLTIAQKMISGTNSFSLLAIPFFLLAAELMNRGGVTQRLLELATSLVGHVRGGLAQVNIGSSVLMSGMSGAAVADASGLGRILIPAMKESGYSARFAASLTAASSTMGPIMPPSIPLVIYGSIAQISIGRLFLAGIAPALLMGAFLVAAAYTISVRRNYGAVSSFSWVRARRALLHGVLPLGTPVVIVGGIVLGIFTPTESAAVACVYAATLGVFYRELTLRKTVEAGIGVAAMTGVIMFLIAASSSTGWMVAIEGIPRTVVGGLASATESPIVMLLFLNLALLVVGAFLDPVSALIMTMPVITPLAGAFGIDPVHLGMIVVLNLMIGMDTPPVGITMYITSHIAGIGIDEFIREHVPFYFVLLLTLLVVTYVPTFSIAIPSWVFG